MRDANSNEAPTAGWKELIAILAAIGNAGFAFYAFMPMGTSFALGAASGRAIGAPLLVVALFQIGKRFRNTSSRYNIFLITSIFVALANFGRITDQPASTDISPQQMVSASLPNLNQNLPETLDNGMRIERYESEGEKLVGNFLIVDSDKMNINAEFWPGYLSNIETLACVEPSYRQMLEYGVIFEYRIRDQEGNLVATVQTSLSDCQ